MTKNLILGLGTGRCGTSYLFDFLNAQKGIFCTNERVNWGWYYNGPITNTMSPISEWEKSGENKICDVGSYTLPHVRKLANFYQNIKLIIIRRDREATIKSWMNWTNVKHNYWVAHENTQWEDDTYDHLFPKFVGLETYPKYTSIASYYDLYYEECIRLSMNFNSCWIETETLDDMPTRKRILSFCDLDEATWNLDKKCKRNAGSYPN